MIEKFTRLFERQIHRLKVDKIRIRFQMFRKHFHVFGNGILKETIKHGINDKQREVGFLSVKSSFNN